MQVLDKEVFSFRLADQNDEKRLAPGYLAQAAAKVSIAYNSTWLAACGGDMVSFFGKSIPQGVPCKELNTVKEGLHWFVFASAEFFKAISKEFRHGDSFFANEAAAKVMLAIGSEIFSSHLPEGQTVTLSPEDTISTCSEGNSRRFRAIVTQHLGSAHIESRLPEINEMARELFKRTATEIDVTETAQILVSRIINRFLLGLDDKDSLAIAEAIVAGNGYILQKLAGTAVPATFKHHAQVLDAAVNKALEQHTPFIEALKGSGLKLLQMKAMLIAIYFTGLGGTISQIGGLMWHLAKNPEYQEELVAELAKGKKDFSALLLKESFRVHPSTLTLDRPTGKALVMTYDYGSYHEERFIPPKSILTLFQPWAAERCQNPQVFNPDRPDPVEVLPWGQGVHMCVGKYFAENLILRYMWEFSSMLRSSSQLSTLPCNAFFNYEPKEHVVLQVKPR